MLLGALLSCKKDKLEGEQVILEGNADVLTITNSIGKLITTVINPESGLQFNLSTLSSGVYLVKTYGKETNYIHKLIVK